MVLQAAPKTPLDLLCEVALSRVSEPPTEPQTRDDGRAAVAKPGSHVLNLVEILQLSGKQLVRYFTRSEANELRRLFKYTCCLMPAVCHHQTCSFGSEAKALAGIREHLRSHLSKLSAESNGRVQFTAETVIPLSRRVGDQRPAKSKPTYIPAPEQPTPPPASRPPIFSSARSPPRHGSSDAPRQQRRPLQEKEKRPRSESPPPADRRPRVDPLREHDYARDGSPPRVVSVTGDYGLAVLAPPAAADAAPAAVPAGGDVGAAGERTVIRSGELPVIMQDGTATVAGLRRYTRLVERDEYKQRMKPKGLAKFISQSEDDKAKARKALSEMRRRPSMCNNYVCRICYPPQRFTALSSLQSHYKSHLGLREFTCQLCQKSFTRKMSLDYHMLIHAHKTRFRCDSCGHEFRHKSHYTEHLRRHTGETPYLCSVCGLGFKARNSYRRHLESKHRQRLTHTGNIVILSEKEHREIMEKSSHEERSRKGRLAPGERPPPSPSRTGFSFVDVVVRDSTGQVEYMCNAGLAAEMTLPPLMKPPAATSAEADLRAGEKVTEAGAGKDAAEVAEETEAAGSYLSAEQETAVVQNGQAVGSPDAAPPAAESALRAGHSMDMLQQVINATVGPEHIELDFQMLPPPRTPPPPPAPRVNLTSSIGNYDVYYSSGNLASTLFVK